MSAKRRSHNENEGFEHISHSAFVPDYRVRQGFTEHRKARRVFFSESQTEEAAGKDTSQAEQTAPAQPPEAQSAQTADEETEGSTESERRPVPEHPVSGTTPPQTSEPQQKKDESERRSETTALPAPSETEQPISPATEEPKPSEPPQPTEPSTEPPTESVFDIGYWISFAKSYAESVGLTLDSGAVYCWDNPIAAGSKCRYTERDIKGYLDRYAKDSDITEVWVWYEQASGNSYEVYIGYA